MAVLRDPATGLLRSDNSPAGVTLPARNPSQQAARPLEQLQAQAYTPPRTNVTSQRLTLGRAFLNAPRDLVRGAGDILRFGGGIAKEIGNFIGRPLVAPAAMVEEGIMGLRQKTLTPTNGPLQRYAFQDTRSGSAERGFAGLSRAVEVASFLPELYGAYATGGVSTALKSGSIRKALPILAKAGGRSALVESPFGGALGYLDARRRGEGHDQAMEQAAAGTALAGGIGFGLPFAGYGLSRTIGPFIPSLSRQGSRATQRVAEREVAQQAAESTLPRAVAREGAESGAGPVLPSATSGAAEVVESALPAAEAPAVRAVSRETLPVIDTGISDDVAARVVAISENKEQTAAVINSLRRNSTDVFDEFGDDVVSRVFRAIDEVQPGLGVRSERQLTDAIVAQNVSRRTAEGSTGTLDGLRARAKNFIGETQEKLVDETARVENVLNRFERSTGSTILPTRDIRAQIDRVLRAPQLAGQFLRDQGFDTIIREAERRNQFNDLSEFLVARQAEDIRAIRPDVELGRSAAQDRAIIRSLQGSVGDLAQKVNLFARNLLDVAVDGGLVARESADALKKTYPNYVPVNRVFSVIEQEGGFGGRGALASLSRQTVVQGLEGSQRAIANPLESLVNRTEQTFVQAERNKAAQQMAGYRNLPNNPFGIRELFKGAEPGAGNVRFNAIVDGVKKSFAIEKEFGDVIATMTPLQLSVIERGVLFATRLLKAGATGFNVPFTVFNLVKDQISGLLNSSAAASTANPYVFTKALFSVLKHDDLYKEAVREGAVTTSYALLRNQTAFNLSRERALGSLAGAVKHVIRHPSELFKVPLDVVENVISRGEEVRRMQEFIGQRGSLLKQGASLPNANILAADATRFVTANFYRRGSWGKSLNAYIPYLNAGIQSVRSFFRGAAQDPVKMAAKAGAFIMMPFAVATAWNLNDPKRKAAYDDIPDWEKENNLIIIPPDPKQDEQGRWEVYKIPLPPNVGAMVIPIRQTFEAAHGLDPDRFSGLAQALIGTTTPLNLDFSSKGELAGSIASQFTPQVIKPTLESYTNKNFFTGAPIVPESMKELPPEMQVRPNTSQTARLIGSQLGISPLKVENFLKSTGGSVATQAINAIDRVTSGTALNPDKIVGGESILGNLQRRSFRATGGEAEGRMYERAGELKTEGRAVSAGRKQQVDSLVERLRTAPVSEQSSILSGITDPKLAKDVLAGLKDAQLGLTTQDKIIKSLGVEDGTRARYIIELEARMKPEEKAKFEQDLLLKKVMTKEVYRQLLTLKQGLPTR